MHGAEGLIVFILFYRTIFNITGCYVAARFAPDYPMGHALAAGTIGLVICVIGAIVARDLGPLWYSWTLAVLALPSGWLGWKLFERAR